MFFKQMLGVIWGVEYSKCDKNVGFLVSTMLLERFVPSEVWLIFFSILNNISQWQTIDLLNHHMR